MFEGRMFVFGGRTPTQTENDLNILDTQLMSWFSPSPSGAIPLPRQDHAAVLIGHKMIVFGGCSYPDKTCMNDTVALNVLPGKWSQVDLGTAQGSSSPSAREGMTLTRIDQNRAVLVGGCVTDKGCFHDVHIIENTTNRCPRNCLGTARGKCRRDMRTWGSTCSCAVGYSGLYCRKVVPCPNNCSSTAEVSHGTCGWKVGMNKVHSCKCEGGWGGLDCGKLKAAAGGKKKSSSGSGSGSGSGSSSSAASTPSSASAGSAHAGPTLSSASSGSGAASINKTTSGGSHSSASAVSTASSSAAVSSATASSSALSSASSSSSSAAASSVASSAATASAGAASADIHSVVSFMKAGHGKMALTSMYGRLKSALVEPEDDMSSSSSSASASALSAGASSASSGAATGSGSSSSVGNDDSEDDGSGSPLDGSGSFACPNACSKRGKCKDGKCYCTPGFTTDDCSQSVEEYEKGIDAGALVVKDLLAMFAACFVAGCCAVVTWNAGSWAYRKMHKRYHGLEDSD